MEFNTNQWHVKLYFWCLGVSDAFLNTYTDKHRSNLCHYIRTIFVWMPLALTVNIAFWLYVFYVLIYFPLTNFGVVNAGKVYGIVGFVTFVCIGSARLFSFVANKLAERRRERRQAALAEWWDGTTSSGAAAEKEEKGPGFIEVIWLYLVSMKQKVCPTIEFRTHRTKGGA